MVVVTCAAVAVTVGGLGSVAGSGDTSSPRSGKLAAPFSQSVNSARNAGRSTQLSQIGYCPVPPVDPSMLRGVAGNPGAGGVRHVLWPSQNRGRPSRRHA